MVTEGTRVFGSFTSKRQELKNGQDQLWQIRQLLTSQPVKTAKQRRLNLVSTVPTRIATHTANLSRSKEKNQETRDITFEKIKQIHVTKTRAREPVKRNRAENVQLDLGGLSGGVEVLEEFLLETTMNRSTCHWRTESVLKSTLKGKNDTKEMNVSF